MGAQEAWSARASCLAHGWRMAGGWLVDEGCGASGGWDEGWGGSRGCGAMGPRGAAHVMHLDHQRHRGRVAMVVRKQQSELWRQEERGRVVHEQLFPRRDHLPIRVHPRRRAEVIWIRHRAHVGVRLLRGSTLQRGLSLLRPLLRIGARPTTSRTLALSSPCSAGCRPRTSYGAGRRRLHIDAIVDIPQIVQDRGRRMDVAPLSQSEAGVSAVRACAARRLSERKQTHGAGRQAAGVTPAHR